MVSEVYNMDNLSFMSHYPDKFFDLAIVDPPYGIDHANKAGKMSGQKFGNAAAKKRTYSAKDWDLEIPGIEYFAELKRVSKNQIIWGGNYFAHLLDASPGYIFWDKDNGTNNFSDGELAYSSFNSGLRKVKITWNGMIQYDMKNKEDRFHPTQKPIRLYTWLMQNYANKGDKILDTHLGSGSSRIAAYDLGFDFYATELDKDYYEAQELRFKKHISQQKLFAPAARPQAIQMSII